jgi:hypothetical protein
VLAGRIQQSTDPIAIVVSGGNIDSDTFRNVTGQGT